MFQTFDSMNDPFAGSARCAALRQDLARRKLDGFLVPRADAHQGEYVPPSDARLEWLTGFAGSAGIAVVLADEAAIFVDGRYTIQVREQVDTQVFTPMHLTECPPTQWLAKTLKPGARLGYDPTLHTISGTRRLKAACLAAGAELVAVADNAVDAVWEDRPVPPLGAVAVHADALAGEAASDKIARMGAKVGDAGADAFVLTQPDSIAWLFNIRGSDVAHTPLPLSFAILPAKGKPRLFIDGRKLSNAVRDHLVGLAEVEEPVGLVPALAEMGRAGASVMLDPDWTGDALASAVLGAGGTIREGADPITRAKAVKNDAEIAGARAAHLRDGAAYARFLAWFDRAVLDGPLDEIGVAERLEAFRAETGALREISFDSISAAGPNAAICHYRVERKSNRPIPPDSLFLIDSGGQYEDGTTDITRTLAVGSVSDEMKRHFTLVLKGHIAIATARFPVGTTGAQIDALARIDLWRAGLDFDHGTGHGVGSYLSVHEGPQRIAKTGHVALDPGMIVSNEPGYYKADSHGIRIENLELVTGPSEIDGGERPMLGFEALTLAPIDRRLMVKAMLSDEEHAWVDRYHARVLAEIGPLMDDETTEWLRAATAPL
ncbi:aminopeptidase P family protein [Stappia sp. ES.058]|uniref:aminopeptidase P family protein n=1 Tax=Stappia sp. ES.058 TaxID=1881061 RepID=UPI00087A4F9B|nr:aminopeptidase P family protein [Stappia sp. ES.058]SDU26675.1 Xaa-Pro aminopeptidase [Stappia sp. ES.058]